MRSAYALAAALGVAAVSCATTPTAADQAPAPASSGAKAVPALATAKQEALCQEQPATTRGQLDELLAKVNADLKANGKKIKIAVAQVENGECSIAAGKSGFVVDVVQNATLSIEIAGKAPAIATAAVSYCHALSAAADGSGYQAAPCENAEVLERYNVESLQTAINDELYKLERMRIQID